MTLIDIRVIDIYTTYEMSKTGLWIVLVIVSTLLIGLVYATGQQILRQGANDPQIQITEDIASQLVKGVPINNVIAPISVDIDKSLAPFVIVYDKDGNVTSSQAALDGKTPELPRGVLDYAKRYTQHRLTWQPKPGVRVAIVVQYYIGPNETRGFVLTGRSLQEVEKRENALMFLGVYGWIAAFLSIGAVFTVFGNRGSKK